MQWFSVGQQAEGFVAIGQEATGVIAIGQMATGFIAVGQLARGVFTLGMLSVGVVSVGMLSLGLVHTVAMLGFGGRGKGMLVIPLCPKLPLPFDLPELTPRADLESGRRSGWMAVEAQRSGAGVSLVADGQPVRAKLGPMMLGAAGQAALFGGGSRLLAHIVPVGQGVEVTRLMRVPPPTWRNPQWIGIAMLQLGGLAAASAAYFWFGLAPVVDAVLAIAKG